ncbi:MAG: hypothetical protein Q7R70_00800 [Candidatus Diapherotrites archaeon]|nr:hypothetical protein [Candidatus Diapherotrites archaeon]
MKAKKIFNPKVFTTILTLDELKKTTDSMPYYLFQIALTARLLAGKNCLEKIKFDKKELRLEIERELMLFLIQYRHAFLDTGFFEKRELFNSIPQSLKKILRGILYLKGEKTSGFRQDLKRIEELLKIKARLSEKSNARIPIDEKLLAVHEFLEELFNKVNDLKVK